MGILALLIAVLLLVHSGMLIERRKFVELTKKNLLFVASIEWLIAMYFFIASIGYFTKYL